MLLCPWDSPGKNTGVGCHFLLQEIFPTQGSNPGLPHCGQTLYHLSHQGSSLMDSVNVNWMNGWVSKCSQGFCCDPSSWVLQKWVQEPPTTHPHCSITHLLILKLHLSFQMVLVVKNPPANAEDIRDAVWILGWEDSLEKEMATYSSILAWRTPWTEEPGRLQSMGSHRVGHNWSDLAHIQSFI